ncbi:hypothetical protein [Halocatena halophila]|uniref:hypothetical protein n=1 Tax=Halocatena halophila TaxID=2814576 RepID=UPI002ECFB5F2
MLRCECGGAVELTKAIESGESVTETYSCVRCGGSGWYQMDMQTDISTTGGCLEAAVDQGGVF